MSYCSWTVDGYGICVDDIGAVTEKALCDFIGQVPELDAEIKRWREAEPIEYAGDSMVDDIMEYWDDGLGHTGLAPIIQEVIYQKENIRLVIADDYNGVNYLLFEPFYPWSIVTAEEKNATEDIISKIFLKYVKMLTDKPIQVTYYSVENGG